MVLHEVLLELNEVDALLGGLEHKRERLAVLGGLSLISADLYERCYKLLSNVCLCVYHLN